MVERSDGHRAEAGRVWAVLGRPEVSRRLLHASGSGLPALYLLGWVSWWGVTLLFALGAVIALGLEALRLLVGLDWGIYEWLTRDYEQDNLAGYALYFISSAPVAAAFAPRIAVPAILLLTIADPVSGLLGAGDLRPAKQSFVLLATFGVGLFIASWFVPFPAAVLGALAATVADGFKPVVAGYVVDDNLSIPPAAAVAMAVGVAVVGAP